MTQVTVTGLANAVAVAAGNFHTCALRSDGTARCWGDNAVGQLGDSSATDRLIPVPVSGLTNVVAVSGGAGSTCAVRVDGAVFCWGSNSRGELGDGTTTERHTPVEVPSFRANVDPTADLASNGHRVLLTAVVNCPIDHKVTSEMTLTQDEVTGRGQAGGKCRGGLTEYPVEVSVRQGAPFELGPAQTEIIATVRDGHKVVDVQEWSRRVEIDSAP